MKRHKRARHPVHEVGARRPVSVSRQLDLLPGKCVSFVFNGYTYTGIPIKNSVNPSTRKEQTFEIWPLPTSDIKNLIDYYGE